MGKSLKNKLKRAPSAYFLFANEERARILKKNASLRSDVAKVAQMIGASWSDLSDKDKVRFQSKAATLKVKADKKIATYRKSSEWKNYLEEKKCIVKEEKAARKAAEKAECGDAPSKTPKKTKGKKKAKKAKKAKRKPSKKASKKKRRRRAKKAKKAKRKPSKKAPKKKRRRRK